MPATPGVTTPSMRRAATPSDTSCACRSPKRARASPSPQEHILSNSSRANSAASASSSSSSRPSEHRRDAQRHRTAKLSASQSSSTSNTDWDEAPRHAATSPCRSPTRKAHHQWGTRIARRREMSVPLLSQTLSHVSLSQSTPPYASDLSPDAMTRTAASSSPPLMDTPETVVADTPRRLPGLPRLRRMNTPAPLATRDLGYPNTAPMPVIHSLLGSPFDSKARLYPLELQSPTWLAKAPKKEMPVWNTDWLEEKDVLPELQESSFAPATRGYTTAEDSGSCTSASSFFSSERHAQRPASRPSVVGIWDGGDSTFYDEDVVPTPNRQLFGKPRVNESILLSTRLLQSSPGQTSPLMGKRVLPSPTGSSQHSPRPFALSRIASASSTTALENEPIHSPTRSGSVTASTRNRGRISAEPFDDDLLSISGDSLLQQRRTSDPVQSSGDAFAVFLARCGGDRATRSEMASHHNRSSPPPPDVSSELNELELELSPLRSVSQRSVPALPPRAGSAPLPHHLTIKTRIDRLKNSPKVDGTPKATTPKRGPKASPAARPPMRRGATAPQIPSIPSFGTPISQLFGDDKPSPAAFASAGLMKKRGGRTSFPRFNDNGARTWSPIPAEAVARSEDRSDPRSEGVQPPSLASACPVASRHGMWRDDDKREVLSQDFELEDTDEDDVSPIRPMRSTFRRSMGGPMGGHHRRVSSTTSDIMTSPASRRNLGHARMSSTASSIGGSRGLRRKGSTMFNSTSDSDKPSPATPTKTLPFASIQPKVGITTPSPTVATTQYPFARRMSVASAASVDTVSPTTTPLFTGRVRTLSRAGPIARTSNPMLAATFRSHGIAPATPALESTMGDMYMPAEARAAGAGRFERDFALVLALGNGEFSQVWKVCSKADGEIWAIKTGRPYTGHKNRLRQLEEVAILRVLGKEQHPHIVRYLESWEQAGRLYIRTEMAECGDLSRYLLSLGDTGGLDEGRVWKMLVELTSALNHIHGHGVLHLDFKPSNVLITREGSLKVADFGLSVFADEQEEKERFTDDNDHNDLYDEGRGRGLGLAPSPILERDFEGDREYLCPEALRDAAPGRPADIFSLGIMTLEAALNVVLPSNGDAWIKLRNDDFSDLDDHYAIRGHGYEPSAFFGEPPAPVVSTALVATIKGMMRADPDARMKLGEVVALPPLARAAAAMGDEGGRAAGPALADEEDGWIEYVLGEK